MSVHQCITIICMRKIRYYAFNKPLAYWYKHASDFHITWKDINSIYLGCNDVAATHACLTTQQIVGKTDNDTSWYKVADYFRHNDNIVMQVART